MSRPNPGAPGAPATLLEVRDLVTTFRTDDGVVRAVDGVSFDLGRGETLGLVGESGSGKSVTSLSILRLIADPPGRIEAGQVRLNGVDLLRLPEADMRAVRGGRIAMVFQDPMTSLNPFLTIGRQLVEVVELHGGRRGAAARAEARGMLEKVGLADADRRLNDYPHQLSGGMRQRVMIAMALLGRPEVILADEPTTALDVTIQAQVLDLMTRLGAELGLGIVLVTHNLGIVAGLARRTAVMYAGRIVELAATGDLFADARHPYTIGLLGSLPGRATPGRSPAAAARLASIPGRPPDLARLPPGCPFAPRCPWAHDHCTADRPPLREVAPGHRSACWLDAPDQTPMEQPHLQEGGQ